MGCDKQKHFKNEVEGYPFTPFFANFYLSEWVIDKRNGIPNAAEGDKNYQAVEYSPGFHKQGCTRPMPQFG